MSAQKPSAMRSARSATVSSANPLKHKNPHISKDRRERFNQLDLEMLLNEFRIAAASQSEEDVEESSSDPVADPDAEASWLAETGFESLAQQFTSGRHITDADIEAQMAGFSAQQKRAVKAKAELLNETLSMRGIKKPSKPTARDVFANRPKKDEEIRQRLLSTKADVPTMFYDLSEEDQKQVHQLNLIQLTTLMEGIEDFRPLMGYKKKRRKSKPDSKLFGTPLVDLAERDRVAHGPEMESSDIPLFFSRAMAFLEKHGLREEGIFRKAGSTARIKELRKKCEEQLGVIDFEKEEVRPHDVAALLKQFLRETPEPLLTDAYIEAFSLTQRLRDQVYGLQLLVMLLPKVHRACLRRLLAFLVKVGEEASVNKMGIRNLAVVFAPTLFYVRGHKGKRMLKEVEIQVTTASTLKLMLENHRKLWEVPSDILGQIRFVNESRLSGRKANKPKDLKRLLTERKSGLFKKSKAPDLVMVKWVSASGRVKATVSVITATGEVQPDLEITNGTTCDDILKATHTPEIYDLYECGGNINRRRINRRARILPILRVNPGLTLMVLGSS